MANIVWLPSMSVGIDKWDSDHRVLLELINRLDHAVGAGAPDMAVVRQAVETLVAYAEVHFQIEEKLMARLEYPRLESHKAEHEKMRAWIAEHCLRPGLDASDFTHDLAEYLVHWLYSHVLTIDMQYTEFFDDHRLAVETLLGGYDGLALAE